MRKESCFKGGEGIEGGSSVNPELSLVGQREWASDGMWMVGGWLVGVEEMKTSERYLWSKTVLEVFFLTRSEGSAYYRQFRDT